MTVYLDINQLGKPHWLSAQGRLDNSAIRKKHRDAYWAKRRAIKDAGYDPNQDRDENGRWTREGLSQLGKKAEWIRQKIDAVADELKFPKDQIFMSTEDHNFTLGGENYRAGGIAVYSPSGYRTQNGEKYGMGDIVIFGQPSSGFDDDFPVGGITAHEIMHQKFRQVTERYNEEYKRLSDNVAPPYFNQDGTVLPELEKEYPVLTALRKNGWTEEKMRTLEEEDGVTAYSKSYWNVYKGDGGPGLRLAINETLSEIASLKMTRDDRYMTPETGAQMTEFLRNWLKSEYETSGSSFAEPEEHASQMEDPWAYAEMMQDTDGDDKFRAKFGTKIYNIKGIRNGTPIYHRPVFTDYPDPVISPTWKKLYDTIEQQYRRINNITDAGYNPDQPRDKDGRWSDFGGGDALKFTLDLYNTLTPNPLSDAEVYKDFDGVLAFFEFGKPIAPDLVNFKHIRTYPQRKGGGRKALKWLMEEAEKAGVGLRLDVDRTSDTPHRALYKLYTGLGFVGENSPRDKESLVWRPKNSR